MSLVELVFGIHRWPESRGQKIGCLLLALRMEPDGTNHPGRTDDSNLVDCLLAQSLDGVAFKKVQGLTTYGT